MSLNRRSPLNSNIDNKYLTQIINLYTNEESFRKQLFINLKKKKKQSIFFFQLIFHGTKFSCKISCGLILQLYSISFY